MGVREVASRESGSGQKKRHFGHTTSSQYYIIIILGQNMGMDFQNLFFAFLVDCVLSLEGIRRAQYVLRKWIRGLVYFKID